MATETVPTPDEVGVREELAALRTRLELAEQRRAQAENLLAGAEARICEIFELMRSQSQGGAAAASASNSAPQLPTPTATSAISSSQSLPPAGGTAIPYDLLRHVMRHAPVVLATQDLELRYTSVLNSRGKDEEFIGKRDEDVFLPEQAEHLSRQKRRVLESRESVCDQLWLDRPYGRVYIHGYFEPMYDSQGQLSGVSSVLLDMTAIKLSEDQLRQSEEKFARAFDTNPAALSITRFRDGVVLDANRTALRMFGYDDARQIVGASALPFWANREERDRLRSLLAQNGSFRNEEQLLRKRSGELFVAIGSAEMLTMGGEQVILATWLDITERKNVEARLRRFFQCDLYAVVYWRADGAILDANDKFLTLTGYSRQQIQSGEINWRTITPPEYSVQDEDAIRQLSESGRHQPFEKEYICANGSRVWAHISSAAWEDNRDEGVSLILDITERKRVEAELELHRRDLELLVRQRTAELEDYRSKLEELVEQRTRQLADVNQQLEADIAERRRMEEQLRLANQRFQVALGNSPIMVSNQDLELRYTWMHNAQLGYSSGIVGRRDIELYPVGDGQLIEAVKREAIRSGRPQRQEVIIHWSQGERCYDLLVNPMLDVSGDIVGVTCAAIDITDRKRSERERLRNKERTELAVSMAKLGEWEVNLLDHTAFHSQRHAEIFGYDKQQADWSLERFLDHVLPELRGETARKIQACINGAPSDFETQIRREDGEVRWIWVRGQAWCDEQGRPAKMFGTVMDITDRKRADELLIRSEKLASVGRMAATVAHEINNPLEIVGQAIYLAATDPRSPQQVRDYLEMATQELERVSHITRQTLAFSRESTTASALELGDCVEGAMRLFAGRMRSRGVQVETRLRAVPKVHAVEGEIRQIISNLLSNSMDALPRGGRILLRISPAKLNAEPAVRFTVGDTGQGIPPEHLKRIFDAFFTTKEVVGTGLGLWITRQILERCGARIALRSRLGRGTVFSIVFPAIAETSSNEDNRR